MNRLIAKDKIADLLAVFGSKISILSSNNELSWNSLAENILIPLLNLSLDCNFVNENVEILQNSTAIDLVDKNNRVTVQVTSSGNFSKVKKTLEKFFDNSLEDHYEKLYILILKDKRGFKISANQEEQLTDIIQDRIDFSSNQYILDFGKLYNLINRVDIDDLIQLNTQLEKELGALRSQLVKNSPAVTVMFDEQEVDLAFKIVKGLLERDLRIRYFSEKLDNLIKANGVESEYCQLLYDVSTKSSATLILSSEKFVKKVELNEISAFEMKMLRNPHLKHILIKLDDKSSFRQFDWISPLVTRGVRHDFNSIINFASNELHKVNKVIEIQDYADFETIIKLYDSKSTFGDIVSYKDSKKKIGYNLLPATNDLLGVSTNYLFIPNGSSIAPTAKLFYKENPQLKHKKESILLFLPKERGQIRLDNRLKNAKQQFKPRNAFYLDEFISKYCANGFIEQDSSASFSSTKNFIQPELKAIEGELSDFDQIENWILSDFDPMLIITGGGGIGKTTLAREIADMYYRINTNAKIVYIEASNPQVVSNLTRMSEVGQIDLYDFYSSIDTGTKISRDLFRVTIDNGNLMLVIDGLDEVFSRIPDFDVEYFINSVTNDFVQQIGVGKVLLTCRTYFWKEQISKENSINHFEIEPFSLDHARDFFSKKFDNLKKEKKAISLLQEMDVEKDEKERFLPFVVDIVGEIIESDNDILDYDEETESTYLDTKEQVDFIVYRLLKREQIKIGIDVRNQIDFLIHLAVFHHGMLNKDKMQGLKHSNLDFMLDDRKIASLNSHPFINVNNNYIGFKYDFFELYFKTLYLSEFISLESSETLNKDVVDILIHEGKFGSSLFYEIAKRNESTWNEDNILKIVDLITSVKNIDLPNISDPNKIKHQIKSSLFALALTINQSKFNNQTATNTDLLKLMFEVNSKIKDLSLVNFGILDGNIKFNFSDFKFENCYFDSYDSFWECRFNNDTEFINCMFYNMPDYARSSSRGISINSFINPRHDVTFDNYFLAQNQSKASLRKKLEYSLSKYFRLFYTNGALQRKDNKSFIRAKYHPNDRRNLPVEVIEQVLTKSSHLTIDFQKVRREDVASIDSDFKEDVFKFLQEGVESYKMKKAIDSMLKVLTDDA